MSDEPRSLGDEVRASLGDWDGKPRILLTSEQVLDLTRLVPHFKGLILGPVPFGQPTGTRASILVDGITTPTREIAIQAMWAQARLACEVWKHPFDEDEWEIAYVLPWNTC